MGISIKHDEIERLIRQLANKRGTSITQAIGHAVRNALDGDDVVALDDAEIAHRWANIRRLQDEIARDGIDRTRSEDEILGYVDDDDAGYPAAKGIAPEPA